MASSRSVATNCFAGDLESAASAVVARARAGGGGYACLANVHVIVSAQREPELRSALDASWMNLPDGAPVAWLQRRNGNAVARRVAGPDLMTTVIERGMDFGLRHFLFGSTPSVLCELETRLRERFPRVSLVGTWAPPKGDEHSAESLERIRRAQPDVLWVALGAPKQELWMARHAAEICPAIAIGVGAAFDFHAGVKRRAPTWMQRIGLEWLHRLTTEPRRLGWRYLSTNSVFVVTALRELGHR
jgi:N-acetylglucosaminyldiphosphoundecaprenol N-acetyl-beta-D-mannosaminyltransferase